MKIYHGSIEQVEKPELRPSNRTLDYGRGFYTTTSFKQAEEWVRRRMKENEMAQGYVNTYELEESALQALNCLIFPAPTEEWVDFVMQNRTQKGFTHSFDIVYGPVANDRVYAAFALYEGGLINKQQLIAELKNLEINQSNLYLLLPSKVAWMAEWLSEDKNVSIVEAIKMIYSSEMFRRLEDESTKMWHLGPVALYQELVANI